ncbi:MAG: hypothetical protein LUC86_08365 [Prevotellaceae bacterium]|nr:hypothetical protein [Prevotellaceae bacterium]
MSSKKERRKGKEKKDGKGTLKLIKEIVESNTISAKEIESFSSIDFPLFSFKYFKDYSINKSRTPPSFFPF